MKKAVLEFKDFPKLYDVLISKGYRVIGPTERDGAIVYDEISGMEQLPAGWVDDVQPGRYRLNQTGNGKLFGYTVGLTAWKRFLHVPVQPVWKLKRSGKGWEEVEEAKGAPRKTAFLGVRPCELRAIEIQDKVKLKGPFVDFFYKKRRENAFVVAVQCTRAGNACFCASMKTGPKAESGFDLALTEMQENGRHYFVMEAGTEPGGEVLAQLPHKKATAAELQKADEAVNGAASHMGRAIELSGLKEFLQRSYDNPEWEKVGAKCLTCTNCTLVCPTCFCTTMNESTDPAGQLSQACKRWDSCFTMDFSYIHGGSIRSSAKSRYRQWLTHKFASWVDQYGEPGCVGCGRCIAWCPAGIDITAEVHAMRENHATVPASSK